MTFWPFLTKRLYRVECFQDVDAEWRWRLVSTYNGQTVATSGQKYTDRWSMERTAISVGKNAKWEVRGLYKGDMEVDP